MKLQEKYAKLLGFSEEDVELAKAIGLLHDIGRFEQLRVYNTYDDFKSIDHADYSCEQLFKKGEIKRFVSNKEWYPIIEYAIRNHNKRVNEPTDDERTIMHTKLIKDTDKIDIIYLLGTLNLKDLAPGKEKIHKNVMEEFMNHELVNREYDKNKNDHYVIQYSFVYETYYDECLKELMKNYKKYHEHHKGNEQLEMVYKEIVKYSKERLKHGRIRKEI